jgi:multiple sugar transport system substrate-binding protein
MMLRNYFRNNTSSASGRFIFVGPGRPGKENHMVSVMRRRRLAVAGLVALLVVLTAAVSASAGGAKKQQVDLVFWTFLNNSKEVAIWNQQHPDIHVTAKQLPSTDYYAKLTAAVKAGNGPDAALVEYQFVPTEIASNTLADISSLGADAVKAKFPAWVWNQVSPDGTHVYGIPQDVAPMGLYYRADVFAKYHIAVPKTWAQYVAAAAKLHSANKAYTMADLAPQQGGQFAGFAWQAGAHWFGTSGNAWTVSVNDPATKKVAAVWQKMLNAKSIATGQDFTPQWINGLTNGHIATWVGAVWGGSYLRGAAAKASGKWRVAPMPQWAAGQHRSGNWGGSSIGVTKSSQHAKEAAQFVVWLNSDPAPVDSMITNSSIMPALTSELSRPVFSAKQPYFGGQQSFVLFKQFSNWVDPSWTWGPTMVTVYNAINSEFGKAVAGKQTLAKALDNVQNTTVADMKKQGFTVAP